MPPRRRSEAAVGEKPTTIDSLAAFRHEWRGGRLRNGVEWFHKAISPLLRSDFAQSTAGHPPNGDLTDSIVPSD
jgi:hypothetical protein